MVHGSWRKEDTNKINIDESATRWPNIHVKTAYMPEAFGTHHSKMIILFRHDDLAQIVILTGNFIQRDWNMSQAIWKSPLLPLIHIDTTPYNPAIAVLGSGSRFKHDLKAYIRTYGAKIRDLGAQLDKYDFSRIKASLVASTPGKQNLCNTDPTTETLWGWPGLRNILSSIPRQTDPTDLTAKVDSLEDCLSKVEPHIVIQVSSIASLGVKWLTNTFFPAISAAKQSSPQHQSGALRGAKAPRFSIVFPTAETIRRSVDGYGSGASIHMKTQSPAQAKQLSDLRPKLCHWAADLSKGQEVREAGYVLESPRRCCTPLLSHLPGAKTLFSNPISGLFATFNIPSNLIL